MKRSIKRLFSFALCAVLVFSTLGASALAVDINPNPALAYRTYTYLGDSISWGYGLDPNTDNHDPFNVGKRVTGSFTDLVADVLEASNGTAIHPAASSGSRLCDYRILLERGMGVENPYDRTEDWYGNRHPERTERLRGMGTEICGYIRESDLVTVQLGINDLTAALVNAACATGLIDLDQITQISDAKSVVAYLNTAMRNLARDPNVLGNLTYTFNREVCEIRTNCAEVVKDVVQLAPDDADILVIGYHKAFQGLRVIPGAAFSPIFDLLDAALVSLNDYYASVAAGYDNVYYVDAPDASVFYPEGTDLVDIVKDVDGFLLGIHPDAEGHAYIADRVLDALAELNTCRHTHTNKLFDKVKVGIHTEYTSKEVCADCGKVLHEGKFVTPTITITKPSYTIQNTYTTILKNIYSVFNKFQPK
ncbi:MAG: hypothetical protein IJ112_03730 [Oscillospiraceae bacterium]|nr:hypothetical protein [Oscillospiraceae bacterium]